MYKFNNDNIVTGYIKQLLHTFNLPMCDVWTPGLKVYQGRNYIYKNRLLKATRTGVFNDLTNFNVVISNYFYGDRILNITKNLELRDMRYDTYTHNYLGEYLRFYSAYKEIDLMSMYNCFNYDIAKNLDLTVEHSTRNITFKSNSDAYVIYTIPIKFNKKYTIAVECSTNVEIASIFYDNELLFKNDINKLLSTTYMKVARTSFQKPFMYTKLVDNTSLNALFDRSDYYNQEKNFKMLIKLPITCDSSITILEGDYTNNYNFNFNNNIKKLLPITVINAKSGSDLSHSKLNLNKYISNLQLTSINTGISYPFSDRLIEYLFDNVITHNDVIMNNVRKVQDTLLKKYVKTRDSYFNKGKKYYEYDSNTNIYTIKEIEDTEVGKPITSTIYEKVYDSVKVYGSWDNNIREALYKIILDKDLLTSTFDTIGYCDKDLEKTLGGLENE